MYQRPSPLQQPRISGALFRYDRAPNLGDCLANPIMSLALALCYNEEQQDTASLLMKSFVPAFVFDSRRFEDHSGSVAYRQAQTRSNLSEYSQSMYTPQTK
jgi:hypothetical protein